MHNTKFTRQYGDEDGEIDVWEQRIKFSKSERTRLEIILIVLVVLLFILAVVFLALFVTERSANPGKDNARKMKQPNCRESCESGECVAVSSGNRTFHVCVSRP